MRRAPLIAGIATLAVASIAVAQQLAKHPVLHEDLPGPGDKPSPFIGDTGSGNPAAIVAGDKVISQPSLDAKPDDKSEPVLGKGGFAADRETSMKPDENTGPDSTLHYVSVFNPDVLPFKRMSAFDSVAEDYTLTVSRSVMTQLAVGGTTDKTRDRFWGDVAIELKPNTDIPLPSVAPDMRILSYEIKPAIGLHFEKDGADNFYVRTDDGHASGTYRLVFLADADAGYFAPALPLERLTARQVAAMAAPELKPAIPPRVIKAAKRTLDKLGVDPDEALGTSFNKLVGFFRAFTAKQAPPPSGDIYRDLCDSQAGVCRHRSFAFMVTANALGIPTRFVENEAHAFVEVWFPQRGWQRIDLGGAALKMEVTGANDKTLHRPRAEDPFEKPPEYKNNYTQLEGDIRGLTDQQLADKRRPLDSATASGSFAGPGKGRGGGSGGEGSGDGGSGDDITPDPTLPALQNDPKKPTPHLAITTADTAAYRGDLVHVEGHADVGGKALPDHRVDIYVSPLGQHGQHATKIGTAFTLADGSFKADLSVPATLLLQTYEMYLSSPEDAYFNGALTDN
jgi:hypothetical protein|nr:transglutaminase domain-containing protein [Kofleriaceae bacterium]